MLEKRKPRSDANFLYARDLMRKALTRQLDEYLERFDPEAPVLLNRSYFIQPLLDLYVYIGTKEAKKSYGNVKAFLAVEDFLQEGWRKKILDYSKNYAYRISNELTKTTKAAIQRAILQGKEDRLNNTQLSEYIRDRVAGINEARANNIARTESTTASNYGKRIGAETMFKEMGTTGYKYWVHGRSKDPRHTHVEEANQKPIPLDQPFIVGGEKMDFAGDVDASAKNRCNCTCTVNYISKELYERRYGGNVVDLPPPVVDSPPVTPPKPKPKPAVQAPEPVQVSTGYAPAKTIAAAKRDITKMFSENTGFEISKTKFSSNFTLELLNQYGEQLNKLTREYNHYLYDNAVKLTFVTSRRYYGVVKTARANWHTQDRLLSEINFGNATDSVKNRTRGVNGFQRPKSAVDEDKAHLATVTHEFAHVINVRHNLATGNILTKQYYDELAQLRQAYHKELNEAGNDAAEAIFLGEYASTNIDEFMAEAFTEYKLHSNPSKYALLVGNLISKYYKKGL